MLSLFVFRSPVQLNVALALRSKTDYFSRIHFLPLLRKGRKSILEKSVLQRNCYIENVVLFEADSIVLLPGCLESSGWQLLKIDVKLLEIYPRDYPRVFHYYSSIQKSDLLPLLLLQLPPLPKSFNTHSKT